MEVPYLSLTPSYGVHTGRRPLMTQVLIHVPDGRESEFHLMYGAWLADEPGTSAEPIPTELPEFGEDDYELFAKAWEKFSARARAFHQLLTVVDAEHPAGTYQADEVAAHLDLDDAYKVAGVLAWPRRLCARVDRALTIKWSEGAYYRLDPVVAGFVKKITAD
jgi:hypothetical protein